MGAAWSWPERPEHQSCLGLRLLSHLCGGQCSVSCKKPLFAFVKPDYIRLGDGVGDVGAGQDISVLSKSGNQDHPRKGQLELVRVPKT